MQRLIPERSNPKLLARTPLSDGKRLWRQDFGPRTMHLCPIASGKGAPLPAQIAETTLLLVRGFFAVILVGRQSSEEFTSF
jgi:hypothetical protein